MIDSIHSTRSTIIHSLRHHIQHVNAGPTTYTAVIIVQPEPFYYHYYFILPQTTSLVLRARSVPHRTTVDSKYCSLLPNQVKKISPPTNVFEVVTEFTSNISRQDGQFFLLLVSNTTSIHRW
jgi:hypothetical protein